MEARRVNVLQKTVLQKLKERVRPFLKGCSVIKFRRIYFVLEGSR